MWFQRRLIITIVALNAAILCGCSSKVDAPGEAEILRAGDAAIEAVHLPADWRLITKFTGRRQSHLRWTRDYTAPQHRTEALQQLDRALVDAGWKRGDDCMGPSGEKCFTYDKPGLHILPTASDTDCPDGRPGCASIHLWMSRD